MKKQLSWLFVSAFVVLTVIALANISPQQTLLTQCADQILNRNVCVYQGLISRYCCIPFPYQQWRKAWCQNVELYIQYRQPPRPPSVYFANRRNCPNTYEACTPMLILHCPTP
ncbi:hypothetical protein HRbin17_00261 [bacterium HR17]|uniref:Uncharacterized protein n=1 Tax=Candidatus Fervidibacter japonicus TaxID=2035412 RepID=A0A2H5X9A3_9BACT|nr:hypothetical protein HRbin17_00261 [bacterium HR17]